MFNPYSPSTPPKFSYRKLVPVWNWRKWFNKNKNQFRFANSQHFSLNYFSILHIKYMKSKHTDPVSLSLWNWKTHKYISLNFSHEIEEHQGCLHIFLYYHFSFPFWFKIKTFLFKFLDTSFNHWWFHNLKYLIEKQNHLKRIKLHAPWKKLQQSFFWIFQFLNSSSKSFSWNWFCNINSRYRQVCSKFLVESF